MKTKAEIQIVAKLLDRKAEQNNSIDLDAYANGLTDMYNEIGQTAQEFAIWVEKNCVALSPRKWEKVIEPDSGCYTAGQLYKMFHAEMNQQNGG